MTYEAKRIMLVSFLTHKHFGPRQDSEVLHGLLDLLNVKNDALEIACEHAAAFTIQQREYVAIERARGRDRQDQDADTCQGSVLTSQPLEKSPSCR